MPLNARELAVKHKYRSKPEVQAHERAYRNRPDVRARMRALSAEWSKNNHSRKMWSTAKSRAQKLKLDFTITPEDIVIPTHCPVFGTPLLKGNGHVGPNSPTLDRVVPSLGYIPSNIRVISSRANNVKRNATLEELKAVVSYYEKSLTGGY